MIRRLPALLVSFVSVTGPCLRAQLPDAKARIGDAYALTHDGKPEAAAAMLRRAWLLLQQVSDKDRAAVEKQAVEELRKVDRAGFKLAQTTARTVKDLLDLAADYRGRGWTDTALKLIEAANLLSPELAGKELQATKSLLAEQKASTGAAKNDPRKKEQESVLATLLRVGTDFNNADWPLVDGVLKSPPVGKDGVFWVTNAQRGDTSSFRIDVSAGRLGRAAVVVGARWIDDHWEHFQVELHHEAEFTTLRVSSVRGRTSEELGYAVVPSKPEDQDGWYTVEAFLHGNLLAARIVGHPKAAVAAQASRSLEGRFGFCVPGGTNNRAGARFRELVLTPGFD
jgi:hypothetical protein